MSRRHQKIAMFFLFTITMSACDSGGKKMNEEMTLEVGHPILRDLAGGGSDSYRMKLEAGQYVRCAADQQGIDVALRLLAPDGRLITEVDSPSGTQGTERASVVTGMAGDYQIVVKSKIAKAKSGRYEMKVEALRPATDEDRTRVKAERIFSLGEGMRRDHDWKGAEASYRQAFDLWRALKDGEGEATALYRIGWMRENQGDAAAAFDLFDQSIAVYRSVGDSRGEAAVLNRRGGILDGQGKTTEAVAAFEQALTLFEKLNDLHGQATSLTDIGNAYFRVDRMRLAIVAYEDAATLWKRVDDPASEGTMLLDLGQAYLAEGRPEEARDTLDAARWAAEQNGNPDLTASVLSNLGELDQRQTRFAEAREVLQKALVLQRQSGDEEGEAITLASLGTTLLKAGDLDGAAKAQGEALALFRKGHHAAGEGIALSNLGRVHHARGEDGEAVARQREARAIFERIGDRQGMALSRYGAARSLVRLGKLADARGELEPALALVEGLRGEAPSLDFRASYFAGKQHYWDLYVDVLMQLHEEGAALEAVERRRARSLLDALGENRVAAAGEAVPALAAEARQVEESLRLAAARRPAADAEIRDLLARQDILRARMRERGGEEVKGPAPLTVGEIQKTLLAPDTLLLVYSLGEERSYLWTVSQRSLEGHVLPGRGAIEDAARRLLDLLPRTSREAQASERRAAEALSAFVLAPARQRIAGFHRLLIVGDGALQLVPFAALPADGKGELLVRGHEIVNLPSASVLARLRQRQGAARKPLEELRIAVIADPVFRADDPRVKREGAPAAAAPLPRELTRSVHDLGAGALDRLPYTRQEADSILSLVKQGKPVEAFGFDATRELLTGGSLRGFHILHIATHSLIDDRQPELSGILFSMVDPQGKPRDGFLPLHRIYDLDLDAGLVVLSACESGAGPDLRGEGLLGITRGFLYAGASQLVVSLWKVDDRSTAELMQRFYHQLLEEGHPPAEALARAQRSMLDDPAWSAPWNWAGFVFLGDPTSKKSGGLEAQDSGGVTVVKKPGSDLPPPRVGPDRRKRKPASPPPSSEEPAQEPR
jgi:CHAT domain-containing protein/tetratricopeptide (TPR) repeat protein